MRAMRPAAISSVQSLWFHSIIVPVGTGKVFCYDRQDCEMHKQHTIVLSLALSLSLVSPNMARAGMLARIIHELTLGAYPGRWAVGD